MSTFRRLIGTAQKALDQQGSGRSRSGGGSDWRSLVRGAADALTGDGDSQRSAHGSSSPRADGPRRDHRAADSSRGKGVGIPTTSMPSLAGDRSAHSAAGGAHPGTRGSSGSAGFSGAAGAAGTETQTQRHRHRDTDTETQRHRHRDTDKETQTRRHRHGISRLC